MSKYAYLEAARNGNIKLMKELELKGHDIHIKNVCKNNAYLLAVIYGHIKTMKYLESKGFNIHYIKLFNVPL
jgi:ankyrin repeat protein